MGIHFVLGSQRKLSNHGLGKMGRTKQLLAFIWIPLCFLNVGVSGGRNVISGYGIDLGEELDPYTIESSFTGELMRSLIVPSYVDTFLDLVNVDEGEELFDKVFVNEVSPECRGHLREFWDRLPQILNFTHITQEDVWTLHMIDSWGKFPEGLLSGHVNAFGDFDECVNIVVENLKVSDPETPNHFEGLYCSTYLTPFNAPRFQYYFDNLNTSTIRAMPGTKKAVTPQELAKFISNIFGVKLFPSFAVCFPNSCKKSEVEILMMDAFNLMYTVLDPEHNPLDGSGKTWPGVEYCYEGKMPDLDAGDISVIAMLSVITALVISSSMLDVALNYGVEKPPKRGLGFQCLNAFSLYTNIPRWLSTRPTADDLGCLHGIRFLSTAWVILAHTWFVIIYVPYWNLVDVKLLQEKWSIMTMMNGTFSVDTFFVLSGLLVAYNVLKMLQKTKGKLNIPMFYIHRYLRLTPVYAVLVGVMATLVPYTGRGPYWFIMDRWGEICVDNWWTNMLYVNNFVNTSWLCQGEAWYLANDMQFYIVSPIFLLPLYHWETIGIIFLAILTLLSTVAPVLMVHFLETSPTTIGTKLGDEAVNKWFTDVYIKPYARIQTYFVGVWLGYILFKTKGKKVNLPLPIVMLFWALSTATCLVCLYGIQDWFDPEFEIKTGAALTYAGLSRFAWGISIAWVIFACVKGYGWLVNDFLSWKVFMPLGRLCYCVYLVSLHLQMILHMSSKQPMVYSEYTMVNLFFAHMVFAYIVGFFFTIMVETPFMQLEKILLEGGGGRRPPRDPAPNNPITLKDDGQQRNGIFYNNANKLEDGGGDSSKQE